MIDCPYSPEFLDWALKVNRELSLEDEAWLLADSGGELRNYLRLSEAGYTLTFAERGGAENFKMAAYDIIDIERYLTDVFGSSIRSRGGLPYIMPSPVPLHASDTAPGYKLEEAGQNRVALLNSQGDVRVVMYGDVNTEASTPVCFSWIVDANLADLRASYLDPDGLPLFPGCLFGPGASNDLGEGKNEGPYSREFLDWVGLDGVALSADGDAWVLTDSGGELRGRLSLSGSDYALTCSGPDGGHFEISSPDITDIERYLTVSFGARFRRRRNLPQFSVVSQEQDLCPGWHIAHAPEAWVLHYAGRPHPVVLNPASAVWFSWLADAGLGDLQVSFLSPDGSPLFPGCRIGPPAAGNQSQV